MVNLFVDCDDTLLLYIRGDKRNPYGFWNHIPYNPNYTLIEDLLKFREANPESIITIWSGGGADYAKECAEALEIESSIDKFLLKDITSLLLVSKNDIVVDDDNLGNMRTHTPFERF